MVQYSEKIYPPEELKERVTLRLLPSKLQVYPRFRDLTKDLGSDVCFVTTSLWEAWIRAMDQLPPVDDQLEIKFMRQHVQINIGCNINYSPQKARRSPGTVGAPGGSTNFIRPVEQKKNLFLPLVFDEWKTLEKAQKIKLIQQMAEEGLLEEILELTHPSVSTGESKSTAKKIWELLENSMTKVTDWLKKVLLGKS